MKKIQGCGFLVLFSLLLPPLGHAREKKIRGCLTISNGSYSVYDSDDSNTYLLQGDTAKLKHLGGKEIEASGDDTPVKAGFHRLNLTEYKPTGDCKAALNSLVRPGDRNKPGEQPVPITGKTGIVADAVPVTTTASVGQTTPPAEVDKSKIQSPRPAKPGAPPVAEQTMQNPSAADRYAVAAERAEIGAGNGTLGVTGTAGEATQASSSNRRPAVVVRMDQNSYSPATVTIAAGQTVVWKNMTMEPHSVTLDPQHAIDQKDVMLPAAAMPFDSGNLPTSARYQHTFSVPGTYRYFCTQHEGDGMVGEVIVRPK